MKKIRSVMVGVCVIALNLAIGRFVYLYNANLLVGIAPGALLMQAALIYLIRSRKRAFLVGFLAFGTLAVVSFAWGQVFQGPIQISFVGGRPVATQFPGSYGADQVQALWDVYDDLAAQYISISNSWPMPIFVFTVAAIWFLPQLLSGLAGGLLSMGLSRVRLRRRQSKPDLAMA